jgi:hypothetical protein
LRLKSTKLKEWVIKAIEETYSDGLTRDAHIDLFTSYSTKSQEEIFQKACKVISLVAKTLEKYDTKGVGVYLHIDLVSNSKVLKKAPKDLTQLISLIEIHFIPEVIIYKPIESADVPLNEFYRVPIKFEIDLLESNLIVFYKEWRADFGEDFQREVNVVVNTSRS